MDTLKTNDELSRIESGLSHRYQAIDVSSQAILHPVKEGRTLILCFDGTSNRYDERVGTPHRVFQSLITLIS
jgi:uncharacterized protein (DUF2235 family)